VGTITTGGWNGTAITTQYGGTGRDNSSAASGSIIVLYGSTSNVIPPPLTTGYVLTTKSGALAPEWGASSAGAKDAITRGFEIQIEQPNAVRCIINSGTLYHATTSVDKATGTILTLATASDWSSGSTVTITSNWNYIGSSATGQIVFSGNLPPNRTTSTDTSPDTPGTKYYSYDGTTYWRVIGAVRENGSSQIPKYYQNNDIIMWDIPVSITTSTSVSAWSGAVSCSAGLPPISTLGIFGETCADAGGALGRMWIRPNNSTWSTDAENGITADATNNGVSAQRYCATDSLQQIQHQESSLVDSVAIDCEGYKLNIR